MGKQDPKAQAPAKAEKKRTVLTPQQRIEKAEAELKALREKAEAKSKVQIDKLLEQRTKAVAKRTEAQERIDRLDAELASLGYTAPAKTDEAVDENVA